MIVDNLIFKVANSIFTSRNKGLVEAYQQRRGRLPDIANPQHYTELMLWRKIVDRNPKFVLFSDKLATKDYVQRLCPDLAVPGTLWIGSDANEIPDDLLRGDVYVKASHGCNFNYRIRGGVYVIGQILKNKPTYGSIQSMARIADSGPTHKLSRSYLLRKW